MNVKVEEKEKDGSFHVLFICEGFYKGCYLHFILESVYLVSIVCIQKMGKVLHVVMKMM